MLLPREGREQRMGKAITRETSRNSAAKALQDSRFRGGTSADIAWQKPAQCSLSSALPGSAVLNKFTLRKKSWEVAVAVC